MVQVSKRAASVPGRMGSHTSALAASRRVARVDDHGAQALRRLRSSARARPLVATEEFGTGSVPQSTSEVTGLSV